MPSVLVAIADRPRRRFDALYGAWHRTEASGANGAVTRVAGRRLGATFSFRYAAAACGESAHRWHERQPCLAPSWRKWGLDPMAAPVGKRHPSHSRFTIAASRQ